MNKNKEMELTTIQKEMLKQMLEWDRGYSYPYSNFNDIADIKTLKKEMKGLMSKDLVEMFRGGMDEDGQLLGGAGFCIVYDKRMEIEKLVKELPINKNKEWDDFITDGGRERPQWELDLEEYGDMHDSYCACMDEDNPDFCTCDMSGLKKIMYQAVSQAEDNMRRRCVEETTNKIMEEIAEVTQYPFMSDSTAFRLGEYSARLYQAKHNLEKLK